MMKKRVLLSWSSGKDSAWALRRLKMQPDIEVVGLFSTVNQEFNRVAIHGVRVTLLKQQAQLLGLPVEIIELPFPCSNADYNRCMDEFIQRAKGMNIDAFAFGDLFLEDIRKYREDNLKGSGIESLFPIWGENTEALSQDMISAGIKAYITCLDTSKLPVELCGHEYNQAFLQQLPEGVDPCGEYGEFHTMVVDGPDFSAPLAVERGEAVNRDGFIFCDLMPK